MTEKELLRKLRRGLGGAIIELKEHPDRTEYREAVLRCCLKNIGYDVQSEGTKGYYLYTAICALGKKDEFEPILINAFQKRLEYYLLQQLADILCLYAEDGSEKAAEALRDKYQSLMARLSKQKTFPFRFCEREQFEYLMIWLVDTANWMGFQKAVRDAGEIATVRDDDLCSGYDWFLSHSENVFGKRRVAQYFDRAITSSPEVKAFTEAIKELQAVRRKHSQLRIEPEVTLEDYMTKAKELDGDQHAYFRMRLAALRFSRQAAPADFLELASYLSDEPSAEAKANMLRVFRDVDFPGDVEQLIDYVSKRGQTCDCENLRMAAIEALSRLKDQRIHDLAVQLLMNNDLDSGLPLLVENWQKTDETLIRKQVLQTKRVSHAVQQDLRDIYIRHRSNSCGDILVHVYENGECTYCRQGIVEAMVKNHVLTERLLQECQYDSYSETRELARRIITKRKTVGADR